MSASLLVTLPAQAPGRAWLITFVDLILLLLTFFVLMYSMSQPDPAKYAPVAQSYAETFNTAANDQPVFARARSFVSQAGKQAEDLAYLETALKAAFGRSAALSTIQFRSTDHYLMISLPSEILGQGPDAIKASVATIFELGGVFANINNRLAVIGMADQTAESWTEAIRRSALIAQSMTRAGYDRSIVTLARVDTNKSGSIEIMIMADRLSETSQGP